jgi:hypothetical protein
MGRRRSDVDGGMKSSPCRNPESRQQTPAVKERRRSWPDEPLPNLLGWMLGHLCCKWSKIE